MPTYVYEVITDSGEPGERFEVVQQMADSPLAHERETGLHRVVDTCVDDVRGHDLGDRGVSRRAPS